MFVRVIGISGINIGGPLLFLRYVNHLPGGCIQSLLILFADNTTSILLAKTNEELKRMLEGNFIQLSSWFQSNGLAKQQL